jgi:succinate dehydrogenase / fumarate reductase membrane anchor subunit
MIDHVTIANPKSRYGNGRHATRGFIVQRITAAFNVLFTLFLIWFVLTMAGAEDAATRLATIRHPVVAIGLMLLIANVAIHMRIGMQEVIDDYIDHGPRQTLATTANTVFAVVVAVLVIGSVLKLLFWG